MGGGSVKTMNLKTISRSLLLVAGVTGAAYALGGCLVSARPGYASYGYATVAQPNTVYYQGGNYGGVYYQPGYYQRHAPFFRGYGGTTVVTQPVYAQPGYNTGVVVAQPQYQQQQYQQPVYGRPGYGVRVNAGVAVPTFNAGVRIGP